MCLDTQTSPPEASGAAVVISMAVLDGTSMLRVGMSIKSREGFYSCYDSLDT